MNKIFSQLAIILVLLSTAAVGASPTNPDTTAADPTAPKYDLKARSLLDLQRMQKKFADLANAVPTDKLAWRPSRDSRSFAEVFLHVAGERYQILAFMGGTPSTKFNANAFEKSISDKAQIVEELDRSWEFSRATIDAMSNADFANLLPKLGPQASAGDVVYLLIADAHENLGELVAYARVNGIVPPWTAEAGKKAATKNQQK
jgi:DinB superfamily